MTANLPAPAMLRLLARVATDAARAKLADIAQGTDAPDPRDVDAADLLDAAADLLTQASDPAP